MRVTLDFEHLRIFEAVARLQSFTAAAAELGTAQSKVSHAVARLEGDLGRRLLDRTTRSVTLTEAGRALRVYTSAMSQIADEVRRHFDGATLDGEVRIGLVEDFALAGLHQVLALFAKQHPRFAVVIRTGLSTALRSMAEQGQLHLALIKRLPGQQHGRLLGSHPLVWAGDAGLFAGEGPVPLVTYPEPSETRTQAIAAIRRAGRTWSIVAESDGITGQRAAVEARLGLAAYTQGLLPLGLAEATGKLPRLDPLEYVVQLCPEPHPPGLVSFVEIVSAIAAQILVTP